MRADVERRVDALKPHPANARTHSGKQRCQIAASVKRFGFNGVVVVNGANVILAGHGRVEAVRSIGLETIPCIRVGDLSEVEERAYVLADNKIALNAGWDRPLLALDLQELSVLLPDLDQPLDIAITGFETGEIDALMADHADEETDPADEIVAPAAGDTVTRSGDL